MLMVSVRKALRVCMSLGTAQMCAGALSCMWHPPNSTLSSWRRPHLCSTRHQGAPGLAGLGMVNDAKSSSGLGRPSLLCLQGCRARHFSTFPFPTSSLRPDATREQLGKGLRTPASWSRLPGWFSPAGGTSFLAWAWRSAQVLQGGAARAGRQRANADLLLLNMSLAAGDPHAADLEDTSAAWCRWARACPSSPAAAEDCSTFPSQAQAYWCRHTFLAVKTRVRVSLSLTSIPAPRMVGVCCYIP